MAAAAAGFGTAYRASTRMPEIVQVTTPQQIEQVRSLLREYQAELPVPLCFPNREWLNLPGDYAPPRGDLLLATISGQPAGCVGLRPFPLEGICEMKRLYVRPTFRGERAGLLLVEQILQTARRLGYCSIRLDTHAPSMRRAIDLYRRLGFVEVPPDPLPPIQDLCYMELRL